MHEIELEFQETLQETAEFRVELELNCGCFYAKSHYCTIYCWLILIFNCFFSDVLTANHIDSFREKYKRRAERGICLVFSLPTQAFDRVIIPYPFSGTERVGDKWQAKVDKFGKLFTIM